MENRPEQRFESNLLVRVWGMSAEGSPFFQNVHVRNISSQGALLDGLEHKLAAGDLIGVQCGPNKARCRVVWVIDGGQLTKVQAGIELAEGQPCPWKDELAKAESSAPAASSVAAAASAPTPASASKADAAPAAVVASPALNKRRYPRYKIKFPIQLRDERSVSLMSTNATDISGRGCYIETMLPLPLGTLLDITFWMDSEKLNTSGIVRACDPGVGMGIEFTGLNDETQQRLQKLVEKLDSGVAALGTSPGNT